MRMILNALRKFWVKSIHEVRSFPRKDLSDDFQSFVPSGIAWPQSMTIVLRMFSNISCVTSPLGYPEPPA